MLDFHIDTNADLLAGDLGRTATGIELEGIGLTVHFTVLLQTMVRHNIAVAPPAKARRNRSNRSNYIAGIERTVISTGATTTGEVGTDFNFGYRMEMGFVGADSLGRHYNQIPRPHFGPAADMIEPQFAMAVQRMGENPRVP